jgi:hypothetical protein
VVTSVKPGSKTKSLKIRWARSPTPSWRGRPSGNDGAAYAASAPSATTKGESSAHCRASSASGVVSPASSAGTSDHGGDAAGASGTTTSTSLVAVTLNSAWGCCSARYDTRLPKPSMWV